MVIRARRLRYAVVEQHRGLVINVAQMIINTHVTVRESPVPVMHVAENISYVYVQRIMYRFVM